MIEIKHKETGVVLHRVEAETLARADLSGLNLSGAVLFEARLVGADLTNAKLDGAYLTRANLAGAYLNGADLSRANLTRANLSGANLTYANLTYANFSNTQLILTNLSEVRFAKADLSEAALGRTIFSRCEDLHQASGLETVRHRQPSSLDLDTLRASVRRLPDIFLRGIGLTNHEIEYLRSLYAGPAIYFSCFISYAHLDNEFALRLHNDLEAENVPCWIDSMDIPTGSYWMEEIDKAIHTREKTVLVCSKDSLLRPQVVREIVEALRRQDQPGPSGGKKLFPVRLDDFIFSEELAQFARQQVARGEWERDWLPKVKAIQMADFTGWKEPEAYRQAFQRLLRDLKQPTTR